MGEDEEWGESGKDGGIEWEVTNIFSSYPFIPTGAYMYVHTPT